MTTPTSSIASVPVTIPSPPPSAPNPVQEGVAPFIFFTPDMAPLTVGVVMTGQLDMMLVMVLVGIIWEQVSVCTTVVSDGVHTSLTRTVVGTVAMDTTVVVSVAVTVVCRVSVTVVTSFARTVVVSVAAVTVVGDDGIIGHVQPSVYITY